MSRSSRAGLTRRLLLIPGVALLLAAAVLAAWLLIAGPAVVLRVLRYGDTQIDDFLHYPARRLRAPYHTTAFATPVSPWTPPVGDAGLDALLAENKTIACLVLRDGALLYECYFQEHGPAARSQAFSVSKSVTSALVGAALAEGLLESVEQPVSDYVPELAEAGSTRSPSATC